MAKSSKTKKKITKKTTPFLQGTPSWFSNTSLHCLLIMLLSFLLYSNTLRHNYTQDDAIVIYDNMFTTKGVKGISGILKYDTFYGFFKEEGKANLVAGGRYRPLSLMMYALEVQLFAPKKKDANGQVMKDKDGDVIFDPNQNKELNTVKFIGHLMNVLLFGLTSVLLYLVFLQLFKKQPNQTFAYFIALGTSLLFVVHPVHTEAVANIKGRDEILTLLGSLAALYYSLRAFHEEKTLLNVFAGILFFLGLLAKENAITFLGVVPIAYWFFTRANVATIGKQMIPFVVAAVAFIGIRASVLNQGTNAAQIVNNVPTELMNNPYLKIENNQYVPFSTGEKAATITYTLGKYVQLLIFPHPLTHDYYPRHIAKMSWSDWQVILSLVIYLALLVFGIRALLRKEMIGFGVLFYLGTLFLMSNIIFPIGTNMAERFLFMPSIGFCFIVALLLYKYLGKASLKDNFKKLSTPLIILGIVSLLFASKTFVRNFVWKDNYTLFTTDIKTSLNSAKLRNSVAGELVETFKNEKDANLKTKKLNEAVEHLKEAIRIHPNYKNAFLILGNAYNYLHQYEPSIAAYHNALRIDPGYEQANKNLGITYREAGKYYGEQKNDINNAIKNLNEAYKILGDTDTETIRLLGVAYGMSGNTQKAISYFQKLVTLQPKNAGAFWNLANAYRFAGNFEKENEFRQKAKQINPNIEKEFK